MEPYDEFIAWDNRRTERERHLRCFYCQFFDDTHAKTGWGVCGWGEEGDDEEEAVKPREVVWMAANEESCEKFYPRPGDGE